MGVMLSTKANVANAVTGSINYTHNYQHDRLTVMVDGKEFRGATFDDARELYLTDWILAGDPILQYHLKVWRHINGDEITDYGPVLHGGKLLLGFGSRSSRTKFEAWFTRYRKVFFAGFDVTTMKYPEPRIGDIKGTFVPDERRSPVYFATDDDELFETWAWIVKHAKRAVIRLNGGWLFTHISDAVLFRMR